MDISQSLRDTQLAFDSVAPEYDGALGNNSLVQGIRARTIAAVLRNVPGSAHLLDLGCGTGLDAETLANTGHQVTAMDWSPLMVQRTRDRIFKATLEDLVTVNQMGFHQLDEFESETFDAAYSDLGALNCAMDMEKVAASLARILKPGGKIIASVIGRVCPWEWLFYMSKGQWQRAHVRFRRGLLPVPMNGHVVWTRYFTPNEFGRIFASAGFKLVSLRALSLFVPPPYMIRFAETYPTVLDILQRLDDRVGGWYPFRHWGDHFLIVMQKHG